MSIDNVIFFVFNSVNCFEENYWNYAKSLGEVVFSKFVIENRILDKGKYFNDLIYQSIFTLLLWTVQAVPEIPFSPFWSISRRSTQTSLRKRRRFSGTVRSYFPVSSNTPESSFALRGSKIWWTWRKVGGMGVQKEWPLVRRSHSKALSYISKSLQQSHPAAHNCILVAIYAWFPFF